MTQAELEKHVIREQLAYYEGQLDKMFRELRETQKNSVNVTSLSAGHEMGVTLGVIRAAKEKLHAIQEKL